MCGERFAHWALRTRRRFSPLLFLSGPSATRMARLDSARTITACLYCWSITTSMPASRRRITSTTETVS
jgi:hypothetical protein